jgi:hypothetical protein
MNARTPVSVLLATTLGPSDTMTNNNPVSAAAPDPTAK